jgi:hypothetical protein
MFGLVIAVGVARSGVHSGHEGMTSSELHPG